MAALTELARIVEALLFLSPDPVSLEDLAEAADCDARRARRALAELDFEYAPGTHGLQLKRVAGGIALATDPVAEEAARRLLAEPRTPPLTPAQAETLAIVAYLQPVSRPEITRIRGVSADSASGTLLERGFIEEAGRSQFGAVTVPHDRPLPQALRARLAEGAAERRRVGSDARRGGRAARPPAARRRAARGIARGLTSRARGPRMREPRARRSIRSGAAAEPERRGPR